MLTAAQKASVLHLCYNFLCVGALWNDSQHESCQWFLLCNIMQQPGCWLQARSRLWIQQDEAFPKAAGPGTVPAGPSTPQLSLLSATIQCSTCALLYGLHRSEPTVGLHQAIVALPASEGASGELILGWQSSTECPLHCGAIKPVTYVGITSQKHFTVRPFMK